MAIISMGIEKAGIQLGKEIIAWTRTSGKSLLTTRPVKVNTAGLRLAPKLEGDVVQFTGLRKPSVERLKQVIKEQGLEVDYLKNRNGKGMCCDLLDEPYITDNNSLFLEELVNRYPLPKGQNVNYEVQRRMLYLSDVNHCSFADKRKFLDRFLKDVDNVDNLKDLHGKKLYSAEVDVSEYSKKAILQAKYNNPERYKELSDLLSLFRKGKAPEHCLMFFPEAHFHKLPKSDIQKLLRGEHYYQKLTDISQLDATKLEIGEVCSVAEKMYVKTPNGFEQLKMDSKTYERLFPPIERYSIAQGDVGNCCKIASYNALIKHPLTRIELYKSIEQTQNGVKINISRMNYQHDFNWDNLNMLNTPENLQGGLGHKMIEYTYDINKSGQLRTAFAEEETKDLVRAFTNKQVSCNIVGPKDKQLKELFCKEHSNGIYIDYTLGVDLNRGIYNAHACSYNDIYTGARQNPWTGLEEIPGHKTRLIRGACVDL